MAMHIDKKNETSTENAQRIARLLLQQNMARQAQIRASQQRKGGESAAEDEDDGQQLRSQNRASGSEAMGLKVSLDKPKEDDRRRQIPRDQDVSNPNQLDTQVKPEQRAFGGKLEVGEDGDVSTVSSLAAIRAHGLEGMKRALRAQDNSETNLLKFVAKQESERAAIDRRVGPQGFYDYYLSKSLEPARDKIAEAGTITPIGIIATRETAQKIRDFAAEITLPNNDQAQRMTPEGRRVTLRVLTGNAGELERIETFAAYKAEGALEGGFGKTAAQAAQRELAGADARYSRGLANMIALGSNNLPTNANPLPQSSITLMKSLSDHREPSSAELKALRGPREVFLQDFIEGSTKPERLIGDIPVERARETARSRYSEIVALMNAAA